MNLSGKSSAFRGTGWRSGFRGLKEKKVAPLNLKDVQQKGVLFHCFSSCLCCNADSIRVWPASPPGSLSNGCPPPRHSLQPRCLVWHSRPLRNRCPLFFFFSFHNCSLISCRHNGLTLLTCSWSCCWYGKIKFCSQSSVWFFILLFSLLHFTTGEKVTFSVFICFVRISNRQMQFWNDSIVVKHAN